MIRVAPEMHRESSSGFLLSDLSLKQFEYIIILSRAGGSLARGLVSGLLYGVLIEESFGKFSRA